jgi:hypothetical protein
LGVLALFFAFTGFAAQQAQNSDQNNSATTAPIVASRSGHNYNITSEDRTRKNPLRFTTLSVGRGKAIFVSQCAMCHGDKGDGKGDLAVEMKLNLPDFTKADALKKYTDGEIYTIIGKGNEVMPSQDKRIKDVHRWEVVNFLRSLNGAVPDKPTSTDFDEYTITLPNDSK